MYSAELLDEENGIWNKLSTADSLTYIANSKEGMKERAIENGILKEATENAKEVIAQVLSPVLTNEYTIEFNAK